MPPRPDGLPISRRRFGAIATGVTSSVVFAEACHPTADAETDQSRGSGRLSVRPKSGVKTTAQGTKALGLDPARDAILHVPASVGSGPVPLLVLLHGAGGRGERQLQRQIAAIDATGVVVLAPDSRDGTWDAIRGDYGPDVAFLNRALTRVFETVAVDPARLTIGGFSDGASYGLSLGLINGDLFPKILVFSPGFVIQGTRQGKPRVFISHGTADDILPIDRCSRRIVPALKTYGYDVTYREFEGGHQVPPAVADEGLKWVAG